ncbi:MAG: Endonuclease [Candidatus Giovannonibacteria bacterium GW2011_GWA2_44_26]|uniref:Endonuclease n=1 Tax=Candidatus Giovannonibacteria bacterium GW2011_GWA2_44_26 TaxID=1618648 RepID=A0A0G1IPI5_9BACT|nr:MAG: Endonuclease [Candidatus Giovannonibacteria bacterium GW2011_GWA2_44_26]
MNTYYVYILASKRNGTLYIGVTNNLEKRASEHELSLIDGFTKKYLVHHLVYYEMTSDIQVACGNDRREYRNDREEAGMTERTWG